MYKDYFKDICEYYNVDEETAIKLGTRSTGRKPSLPGSATCESVSGMTYEDIWSIRDRDDTESIFQFYRDQGAWSTFRQCVRHKDMTEFHINFLSSIFNSVEMRENFHICEYGCGIAPFLNTLVTFLDPRSSKIRLSITDVENCEHFNFAKWRLRKKIEENNLPLELNLKPVTPASLPAYDDLLDLVLIFEVMEHVPSPLNTIKNIHSQLNNNGIVVENFIKHEHSDDDDDGPDLASAAKERDVYYSFLSDNFELIGGPTLTESQDGTRIWRKK
tara:strand:+ start:11140 stop:11961 length:822 start_codon:yes stop_codon:yes gene_type:complete